MPGTISLSFPIDQYIFLEILSVQREFFDQLWKPSSVRICSKQDTIRFTRVKKLEDSCCRLEKRCEVRFYNSNEIRNPFGRKGKRREENPWNLFAMFNQANEMRVSHRKLIFISNAVANAEEWHYSGVKMIANISRNQLFQYSSYVDARKFKRRFNSGTQIDWFCFLISIEVYGKWNSRWLIYLFFKDDRVPSHNWVQSLKRVCAYRHHCVFYKFVTEASILITNPLNPRVLCIGWRVERNLLFITIFITLENEKEFETKKRKKERELHRCEKKCTTI